MNSMLLDAAGTAVSRPAMPSGTGYHSDAESTWGTVETAGEIGACEWPRPIKRQHIRPR